MQKTLLAGVLGLSLAFLPVPAQARRDPKQPVVKVAILLDTSNSMDGLITQAKNQLWKIVNELSKAELGGRAPRLEVALYEYGNDGLPVTKNYVRRVLAFTTDLDRVSEELFRLKTNGGEEYCGAVISDSLKNLDWGGGANDMRAIFIAGNEPFDQGGVSYKEACAGARQKGILVNTIFCGNRSEGANSKWEDGAQLAGGRFLVIDQDQRVADVPTPYDRELSELGQQINKTYVQYGPQGRAGAARQMSMDEAAAGAAPSVAANRAATKATSNYSNSNWDVVDAKKEGVKITTEQLPAEMQKMNESERNAYVEKKRSEREKIQKRILELNKKRDDFIAKNQKAQAKDSLDSAVLKTIRVQAETKGYKFEK
ncbi:MAG: vWA domain-containing protein [Vulcanimicrobiota bacterium]